MVAQDVVGTSPEDDAGLLFCNVLDDVALHLEELVLRKWAVGAEHRHPSAGNE